MQKQLKVRRNVEAIQLEVTPTQNINVAMENSNSLILKSKFLTDTSNYMI